MRDLAAIGQKNWEAYCSEEMCDMKGHLMTYPIQVTCMLLSCLVTLVIIIVRVQNMADG